METGSIKRPSFQFYPGDWLNDAALRMVSVPARGLWIEMICLMHQGSDYGYLKVNGKVILPANLARMSGATLDETVCWLSELEDAGVFARDPEGCIFSKRMIRDERVRSARAAGGKLGGNPNLKKVEPKVNLDPNVPPTPSSSSSSSSSKTKPKTSSSAGAAGETVGKVKPFDQFWDAYPNRVAKIAAQKAWAKLKLDAKVGEIVAAIEAQKEGYHWRNENGRFIPNPASWLNAGRWLDQVRPYVAPPPKMPPGWWESAEGMKAAGLMLDPPLTPNDGEGQKAFVLRIRVALGEIDLPKDSRDYTLTPPPRKLDRTYTPPAPPPGVELTPEQLEARKLEMREALRIMNEKAGNTRAGVPPATPGDAAA